VNFDKTIVYNNLGKGKVYITDRTKVDTTTVEIGLGIWVVPSLTPINALGSAISRWVECR